MAPAAIRRSNWTGPMTTETAPETPNLADANTYINAATQHAEDDDPDHEVGDLQEYFTIAFGMLSKKQKKAFAQNERVRELLDLGGVSDGDFIAFEPSGKDDKVPVGTEGVLMTKCGKLIESTYELVYGTAAISAVTRKEDGTLDIDHDDETEIDWNSQRTVREADGQMKFVTEDGEVFLESEVIVVPEGWDPDDEDEEGDESAEN